MANNQTKNKLSFGQRINRWLDEEPGRIFKDGKWRFWFPMLCGFGILNALLTASVFGSGDNPQTFMGAIVLSVGALLAWLAVGTLHYSDSEDDEKLARGVSALDSIALLFVVAHFCFLLWIQGHLWILQEADKKFEDQAKAYNESALAISSNAVKIAQSVEKAAKMNNDAAYQTRKAAEAGAAVRSSGAQFPSLSVAPITLAEPERPQQTAAQFLAEWDWWVRMTNFGELALAAITLIFIRNRSARQNAQYGLRLPVATGASLRQPVATMPLVAPVAGQRQKTAQSAAVATGARPLTVLREHLREIAKGHPGRWFKADLIKGGVAVRLCERQQGREVNVAQTRQSAKLLAEVDWPDFRERLIAELKRQGFPI